MPFGLVTVVTLLFIYLSTLAQIFTLNNENVNRLGTPSLSFSTQNVRSLNISTKNDITTQKIISICSLKSDIILLSDVRLNSIKQKAAVNDIEKKFFMKGYNFLHNSTVPSRGVGMLIRSKIMEKNFRILNCFKSTDCNMFIIKLEINSTVYTLASIYGPNHDTELEFFDTLRGKLLEFGGPFLIGGDWNATMDPSLALENNLDILNMRALPSLRRSNKIIEMCGELSLIDPFRSANPFKREYTYIPSNLNENNRSRLDFFLASPILINNNTKTIIPHCLNSTYFDHKSVTLLIDGKKLINRNIIKDCILNNVDLPAHVRVAVTECYLLHWAPGINVDGTVTSREAINEYIGTVGRICETLDRVKNIERRMAVEGNNNLDEMVVAGLRAEVQLLSEELPTTQYLENLSLGCEPEIFFETLINCIKNNVLSHQATVFRTRNLRKKLLAKEIAFLKQNFLQNKVLILEKERQLPNLVESELRDELLHYKKFENLNDEKITPHFMSIVKTKNAGDSLENIKHHDGSEFISKDELKKHIGEYYKDIYKQPCNKSSRTTIEDVNNFLGPVANHPTVLNAKLSELEKIELESEITEQELTQSINNANLSSAPGADGVSNRFIKHFWVYFKVPLLKLCKKCFDTGTLPMFLRTANIKLIPKKGDISKIKNWRPISLLNCFYKVISRVITARLRKFIDKMTPICQKGYSSTRYCQEVLIEVIEGIEKCNNIGKKGGLLSLDIKKAFDSLSHSYLKSVYQFYNFGPKLQKWLVLLCTNRKACIIIDTISTTEHFDLERGNAQGDTISPFLFNIGYQILLFKLELSLQIKGILSDFAKRNNDFLIQQGLPHQVSNDDPKAFALADDCSLLVELSTSNLQCIIKILRDFEEISGLSCNVEKTSLMPFGNDDAVANDILGLGFEITTELVLLGTKIKNTSPCFAGNETVILEKIRKQSNFWKRFNLSLPGRINVAKSFLYSQINYLGCFLPFDGGTIREIENILEEFVGGNLRIAKHRFYQKRSEGGLELINLRLFLGSQCLAWLKRAFFLDAGWKRDIFYYTYGCIFNIRQKQFNSELNPILHNIAGHAEKFIYNFSTMQENYKKCHIFDNPCINFDVNSPHFLKRSFFTNDEWRLHWKGILNLRMDMILNDDGTVKQKNEFEDLTGILISDLKYNKLRGLARSSTLKYAKIKTIEKKTDTVQDFLMRIKKGSKRIRKVFEEKIPEVIPPNILKFAELTNTFINVDESRSLNSSWGPSYLQNSTRTFIFKLHNNTLGTNTRVSNFVRGHPRTCTFCDLRENPEENDETILHLFFECVHVEQVLVDYFTIFLNSDTPRFLSRNEFFVGFNGADTKKNRVLNLVCFLVKYYIWECRSRFSIPNLERLRNYVAGELIRIGRQSRYMRALFLESELFLGGLNMHDFRF